MSTIQDFAGYTGEVTPEDLRADHHTDNAATDVAAANTSSLGRAAQPPPSEKSSTLDAKDAKQYEMKYPSGQSESTSGSARPAAHLVAGVIRKTRLVNNPHLKVHTNNDNDKDAGGDESKDTTPPPLPPRDTHPIPVPPRTYKALSVCKPSLPPRHYLEEAKTIAKPPEEQSDAQTMTAFSQEEHNKECYRIPNVMPPTTVLVPKASSSRLSLDTRARRDNCHKCDSLKSIVKYFLMNHNTSCICKKKVTRRHSN